VTYDLGDVVSLAVAITDSTGAAANAGAVACTITHPDGTTSTPAVSNPATGSYTTSITPTQVGRHGVRWVATGANASAFTDAFTVLDPAEIPVVSLTEVKRHLNITSTTSDEELRALIVVAQEAGERYTGRVFGRRTVTDTCTGGRNAIALTSLPVLSVTSVSEDGSALTGDDYTADLAAGVLYRADGGTWDASEPLTVSVVYVAGYTAQPAPDRQGALEMIRHLWDTQRGSMAMLPRGADDYNPGAGYSIPRRVSELWDLNRIAGF